MSTNMDGYIPKPGRYRPGLLTFPQEMTIDDTYVPYNIGAQSEPCSNALRYHDSAAFIRHLLDEIKTAEISQWASSIPPEELQSFRPIHSGLIDPPVQRADPLVSRVLSDDHRIRVEREEHDAGPPVASADIDATRANCLILREADMVGPRLLVPDRHGFFYLDFNNFDSARRCAVKATNLAVRSRSWCFSKDIGRSPIHVYVRESPDDVNLKFLGLFFIHKTDRKLPKSVWDNIDQVTRDRIIYNRVSVGASSMDYKHPDFPYDYQGVKELYDTTELFPLFVIRSVVQEQWEETNHWNIAWLKGCPILAIGRVLKRLGQTKIVTRFKRGTKKRWLVSQRMVRIQDKIQSSSNKYENP